MSTCATVHFVAKGSSEPRAIIYRHCDGYPEGLGEDLKLFLADVQAQTPGDTRFNDPSYLAAKFVVWQAEKYARDKARPLAFLSVGVVMHDPGDIEYRYILTCSNGDTFGVPAPVPTITCERA